MRITPPFLFLGVLAIVLFVTPTSAPPVLTPYVVDQNGERPCVPSFAVVQLVDRSQVTAGALLDDLAYTAAAAGPVGTGCLLSLVALLALLSGLWSFGLRGGLRRTMLTFALGVPICLALLYSSSFLRGHGIRLGPGAKGYVAASLHTHTNTTTGLLSPSDVVRWHYDRGFTVVNISDKDTARAARVAQEFARTEKFDMLVLAGEEWHGRNKRPDLVLVHIAHDWDPQAGLTEVIDGVKREGGAVIIAHPWSKLELSLDKVLSTGVDGMELVNGVIHGGEHIVRAAQRHGTTLVGSLDYKYGPHVTALTLIPEQANTPKKVVEALRQGLTKVVFAVPGGPKTGASWRAGNPGLAGMMAGIRTLKETSKPRRAVWFAWIALVTVVWTLSLRFERRGGRRLGPKTAQVLFLCSCLIQYALPAMLSWQVREAVGTVPVRVLLIVAAVVAIPLLASVQALAHRQIEAIR